MDQKKPEVIYSFAETYFANLYSVDWVDDVYFSCQILKCTQLIKGSLTFFKTYFNTHQQLTYQHWMQPLTKHQCSDIYFTVKVN